MTTITKHAEEFKDLDESITRNLHVFLPLTMEILHKQHENIKRSMYSEYGRQAVCLLLRLRRLGPDPCCRLWLLCERNQDP